MKAPNTIKPIPFGANALEILRRRYLHEGETPEDRFWNVAHTVAKAELEYGASEDAVNELALQFYGMFQRKEFFPNSPTIMNIGKPNAQLSACFVLSIEDSMDSIFSTLKNMATIHKSGGGTGFDFSALRPKGSRISTSGGQASGPVSFMKVFDAATSAINQGGMRRGANMGLLRVDHPDIFEFIRCKDEEGVLTNFNISVALTNDFMRLVNRAESQNPPDWRDTMFDLVFDGKVYQRVEAKEIWDAIVHQAWKNGEPGAVYIDTINAANRNQGLAEFGDIVGVNPCAEQPLLPYESCNLGSINLAAFVKGDILDHRELTRTTRLATRFLDNVLTINCFPLPEVKETTLRLRKIGLGIMGLADALILQGIPYDSEQGFDVAQRIMRGIRRTANDESAELGKHRGNVNGFIQQRNALTTTIAPTGTISMIAECSSGIEPLFSLAYTKTVLDGTRLRYVHPVFEQRIKEQGLDIEKVLRHIEEHGTIQEWDYIPQALRDVFVTARDIEPRSHLWMQTMLQKEVDNAISKTINLPISATEETVADIFREAYRDGIKGLTIYRDGSRSVQVLTNSTKEPAEPQTEKHLHPVEEGDGLLRYRVQIRQKALDGTVEEFGTGCGSLYITAASDEDGLYEVFCNTGKASGCKAQSEALGRLVSYVLRNAKTKEQLQAYISGMAHSLGGIRCSSCLKAGTEAISCPDAIARTLRKNENTAPNLESGTEIDKINADINNVKSALGTTAIPCPDCGNALVFQEGCRSCPECGYSKCS